MNAAGSGSGYAEMYRYGEAVEGVQLDHGHQLGGGVIKPGDEQLRLQHCRTCSREGSNPARYGWPFDPGSVGCKSCPEGNRCACHEQPNRKKDRRPYDVESSVCTSCSRVQDCRG